MPAPCGWAGMEILQLALGWRGRARDGVIIQTLSPVNSNFLRRYGVLLMIKLIDFLNGLGYNDYEIILRYDC